MIYITEGQLERLNANGAYSIYYRKVELLKEKLADGTPVYNIFPTIAYTPKGGESRKKLHMGNYLYPDLKVNWNENI